MDEVKKGFMRWLMDRLAERTTAAGIGALGAAAGMVIEPTMALLLATVGGGCLIFVKDKWLR